LAEVPTRRKPLRREFVDNLALGGRLCVQVGGVRFLTEAFERLPPLPRGQARGARFGDSGIAYPERGLQRGALPVESNNPKSIPLELCPGFRFSIGIVGVAPRGGQRAIRGINDVSSPLSFSVGTCKRALCRVVFAPPQVECGLRAKAERAHPLERLQRA
jgi:hypothetical protein